MYFSEDNTMHITLQKRDKGQTWSSPIMGQAQLDPYTTDLEQRRLMLQRFQEEVLHLNSLAKDSQVSVLVVYITTTFDSLSQHGYFALNSQVL